MNLSQSTFLLTLSTFLLLFAATSASSIFDYRDALTKSLLYFEAQRSGHLPHNQRVSWRDHSALDDGLEEGVDLVGGYYDAGDHVKFGLPMAFTVTLLAWSAIEYGEEIHANNEYEHVLEAIKWGTDYFIKAHTKENELWVQVGDGDMDHWCWQRPEDMTTSRRAYKVDEGRPGSEVAGETAAAMAAAAIVFRGADLHYSRLLLRHSQQLFSFANKHRGRYDESVKVARGFYPSASGYGDELLWAALWLHSATGKSEYLDFVVENGFELGGAGWAVTEFSWDIKYPGLQIIAAKLLTKRGHQLEKNQVDMLNNYKSKAEHYLCACLNLNPTTANVARTPGGLLYVRRWNNMQYVTGAAFLLTVYSDHLLKSNQPLHCPNGHASPHDLLSLAKSQVDYILGSNPRNMSYLVGFGSRYPERVHHRAGSIVSYKSDEEFVGCAQGYDNWFGRQMENPNVVTGALVGGPDLKDEFRDKRGNYMQTEACTYNTAPLVGLFARLGVQTANSYTS